tara:strand:+ start:6621 stop:6773 length:153 start_codon:yes stop_codon:yes gene_type:complete
MKSMQYSVKQCLVVIAMLAIAMAVWKYQEPALAVAGAQLVALFTLLRFAH